MNYRTLGKTGYTISEVGFGAWAIGGSWGPVDDRQSTAALHAAIDNGVTFIDTADVYGDGRSERLVAQVLRERDEELVVATKAGRRLDPHEAGGYERGNLEAFIDRSLRNLDVDALDLLQLHCPPTDVYYMPEVFDALDTLCKAGKLRHYGVSVERVEEAIKATEYPGVATVQIVFNAFRQRPAERFFALARERGVGILARVPLASGLLTGKFDRDTRFHEDDHRHFNRDGAAFDQGETFAGVPFGQGLEAVEALREQLSAGADLAKFALRWILMHEAVSAVIPGARKPHQAEANASASRLPPLTGAQMDRVRDVYDRYLRAAVHQRW